MLTNVVCLEPCLTHTELSIMWVWALSHYFLSWLCWRFKKKNLLGVPSHPNHLLPSVGFCWYASDTDALELPSALFGASPTHCLWTDPEVWNSVPWLPDRALEPMVTAGPDVELQGETADCWDLFVLCQLPAQERASSAQISNGS